MKTGPRQARGLALLALLPALPSPLAGQDRPFPYQLRRADVALGAAAAASAALGFVLEDRVDPLAVSEISALDRGAVNGFDRFATDNWSTRWQDASDRTRDGLIVAAGLVTFLPPVVDQR